jgi:hypothetical protein
MFVEETYELLFRMLEENWLHARQAEDKRAVIAIINLVIVSALQGIVAFTGLSPKTLFLSIWIIILGVYGIVASAKLYERSQFHILRARKLRTHLDELCPDARIEHFLHIAEDEHKVHYTTMMNVRLNAIWIGLHALITATGTLYTIISLIRS